MFDIAYQSKFCHELKYVTGQVILDFDVISQVRHRLNGVVMIAKRYEEYSKLIIPSFSISFFRCRIHVYSPGICTRFSFLQ